MITYGHEKYIQQAVEGVLMQECAFDVELIIANDCSPDDTDKIIEEIRKNNKHASRIKYIRQEKNIGMTANMLFALQYCDGTYIAFCEGDDYWTDSLKLHKQVEYLVSNPGVALIYTKYKVFIQDTGQTLSSPAVKNLTQVDSYNELIKNNYIALLTVMADGKILLDAAQQMTGALRNWCMVDYPLWLYISSKHKIAYLPECTATYRYLPVSASHSANLSKNLKFLRNIFLIRVYFHKNIKRIPPKILLIVYRNYYYESAIYIYRKLKQKVYDKKTN